MTKASWMYRHKGKKENQEWVLWEYCLKDIRQTKLVENWTYCYKMDNRVQLHIFMHTYMHEYINKRMQTHGINCRDKWIHFLIIYNTYTRMKHVYAQNINMFKHEWCIERIFLTIVIYAITKIRNVTSNLRKITWQIDKSNFKINIQANVLLI